MEIISPDAIKIFRSKPKEGIDKNLLVEEFAEFKEEILCSICLDIVNEPLSCAECFSMFCSFCLKTWSKNNKNICPLKCKFNPQKLVLSTLKLLNKIKLKCGNDCGQNVMYENYLNHFITECPLSKIHCGYCHTQTMNYLFNQHIDICEFVIIECCLCKALVKRKDFLIHQNGCPEKEVECKKCMRKIKNKDTEQHDNRCIQISCPCCKFSFPIDRDFMSPFENKEKSLLSDLRTLIKINEKNKEEIYLQKFKIIELENLNQENSKEREIQKSKILHLELINITSMEQLSKEKLKNPFIDVINLLLKAATNTTRLIIDSIISIYSLYSKINYKYSFFGNNNFLLILFVRRYSRSPKVKY
jgi:hypothetical protein